MKQTLMALALALAATPLTAPAATADTGDVRLTCFPHGLAATRYDDTWGAPRSGGRGHRGADLLAEKMIPVIAVADGTVTRVEDYGSLSGAYLQVAHDGFDSLYMHLNNDTPGTDDGRATRRQTFGPGIREGAEVEAGDVIAYVGDSGNAEWTSAHTHFELHIDGMAVNPYPYVLDAQRRSEKLADKIAQVAFTPAHVLDEMGSSELVDRFASRRSLQCLPDTYQDVVEHLGGEPTGERVDLTGMERR